MRNRVFLFIIQADIQQQTTNTDNNKDKRQADFMFLFGCCWANTLETGGGVG